MDWKKEISDTALYLIVGLILAFLLNLGMGYALGTEKPVMAVVSGSMEPTFYKGDLVVVKGIDPREIGVGDVIVYDNPIRHIPVVHRVVGIEKEEGRFFFYTKGDNSRTNQYTDQVAGIAPPIRDDWVEGRVVLIVPKLGWFKVVVSGL